MAAAAAAAAAATMMAAAAVMAAAALTLGGGIRRRAEGQHLEVEHFLGGGVQQFADLAAAAAGQYKNKEQGEQLVRLPHCARPTKPSAPCMWLIAQPPNAAIPHSCLSCSLGIRQPLGAALNND